MTLRGRFISALAAGGLVVSLMTPAAFAATSGSEISGNGSDSNNRIYVTDISKCKVTQVSKTNANIGITLNSNTGGNNASGNTGGDVSIDTGSVTNDVTVTVMGGSNEANDPCACLCQGGSETAAVITENGTGSDNKIKNKKVTVQKVKQKSKTNATLGISADSKTGKNKAKNNTNGSVDVTTGDVDNTVDVSVEGAGNTL